MMSLAAERARLDAHFRAVLDELADRDMSHLGRAQRESRHRLIDELARYASAGRFPRNRDFRDTRMPYFVDASGTRCAMAHLIESTGERALVARIAATAKHARVRELARDRALVAWLARAGLTAAEAARIQPEYCFVTKADACFCDRVVMPTGVLEATVVAAPAVGMVTAHVDAIHGNAGTIASGDQVSAPSDASPGALLLIEVEATPQMLVLGNSFQLHADGTVVLSCMLHVPPLAKTDAIDAMLTNALPEGEQSGCAIALSTVDPQWGDSQCEPMNDRGGCAAGDGAGLPFVAVAAAALWSRRAR